MALGSRLPPLDGGIFITDGGMETTLIFQQGLELPEFASFVLLDDRTGPQALRGVLQALPRARARPRRRHRAGTPDLARERRLGRPPRLTAERARDVNRTAVALLEELRTQARGRPPHRDQRLHRPARRRLRRRRWMSAEEAEAYHAPQIATFAGTEADLVSALTMTYANEAIGIVRAARGGRNAGRDLVHGRDRRPAAERAAARRSDRARSTRRRTATPRTSWSTAPTRRISSTCSIRGSRGSRGSAASERTRRRRATPSWTSRTSWTRATRTSSPSRTGRSARDCPTSPSSAGAAGRTTAHVREICDAILTR